MSTAAAEQTQTQLTLVPESGVRRFCIWVLFAFFSVLSQVLVQFEVQFSGSKQSYFSYVRVRVRLLS